MGALLSIAIRFIRLLTAAVTASSLPIRHRSDGNATATTADDSHPQESSQQQVAASGGAARDHADVPQRPPEPSSAGAAIAGDAHSLDEDDQCERVQRADRHACGINKLADFELQLVLQFLDKHDKLDAAHCTADCWHS